MAGASLNRIFLIGRLTKDPELRYLPNGTPKAELRLATSRQWKDKSGEQQEQTCYIDVAVWSRQGEIVNQYLKKGSLIFLEGRLDYQEWEGQDGQKRSKHLVTADRVQFLDSGNRGGAGAGGTENEEGGGFEANEGGGGRRQGYGGYARGGAGSGGGYAGGGWSRSGNARAQDAAGGAQTYGAPTAEAVSPAAPPPATAGAAPSDAGPEPHGGPAPERPAAEAMGVPEDDLPF